VFRWSYLAIPIGLSYEIGSSERFRLYGLLEPSYVVRATRVVEEMSEGTLTSDVIDQWNRWDLMPVFGLSVAPSNRFEIALQHHWGIRNLADEWDPQRNRSVSLLGTIWITPRQ
jgi:hypothetical protein